MSEPLESPAAIKIPSQSCPVRGRPFPKGNKLGGRKLGSRNKATLALQALLDDEGLKLTRTAVDLALGGDTTALRICIERLLPPARERRVALDLPELLTSAQDVPRAIASVIQAVSAGDLTPNEGQTITAMLEMQRKAIETADLEARIEAIETKAEETGH